MRYQYFFIITLTLILAVNITFAQLPWTKHNENPVLTPGEAGVWDSEGIQVDAVIFDGETYHMWYTGWNEEADGVGYATSSDRINWTKYENNPVFLKGETGQWDDEFAGSVTVIQIDTLFHMWYGGAGEVFGSIGYATSPDGINWTRNAANPVLNAGEAGSWDRGAVQQPAVLYDGEGFHMWYHGASANFSSFEIGYAFSPDGINWTKDENNPVIKKGQAGAWDDGSVISPFVIKTDSLFHLWYQSLFTADGAQFGYAISQDGSSWTKSSANPVYNEEGGVLSPTLIFDNKTFHMWYGYGDELAVGYATAGLQLNVPSAYPTIQAAIDSAKDGDLVLVADGTYQENINFKGKAITVASHCYVDGDTNHINNTIIDGSNPSNPDSASVVTLNSGEDTTSVLYGLTITGGSGTNHQYNEILVLTGAGVFCVESAAKLVKNRIIRNRIDGDKVLGGGVAVFGQNPDSTFMVLEDNNISDNYIKAISVTAWAQGGGVSLLNTSARIVGNIFERDSVFGIGGASGALDIGGYSGDYPAAIIKNNFFRNNIVVASESGAIGGAVTLAWTGEVIMENNLFDHNITISKSSDGWAQGGGVCITDQDRNGYGLKRILNNRFFNNTVYAEQGAFNVDGGGMYIYKTAVEIGRNEIINNSASGFHIASNPTGGGIGLTESRFRVENNIISNNFAEDGGGGIYIEDQPARTSDRQLLVNNTIVGNESSAGGGISIRDGVYVTAMNNILWDNSASSGAQIYVLGAVTSFYNNNIQGTFTGTGANNINSEPRFKDSLDFHLSDSSPCIGAGTDSVEVGGVWFAAPEYDFYGNMRPNPEGSFPDIGAFESELAEPVTSIEKEINNIPLKFALHANFPNPFNPATTISYQLAKRSLVDLSVYNALGQKVAVLVDQQQTAGNYRVTWDASGFASGVYFYRLQTNTGFTSTRKLILLK